MRYVSRRGSSCEEESKRRVCVAGGVCRSQASRRTFVVQRCLCFIQCTYFLHVPKGFKHAIHATTAAIHFYNYFDACRFILKHVGVQPYGPLYDSSVPPSLSSGSMLPVCDYDTFIYTHGVAFTFATVKLPCNDERDSTT